MPLNVQGSDSLYWAAGIDVKGMKTGAAEIKGILAMLKKSVTAEDIFAGIAVSAAAAFAATSKQAYDFAKDFQNAMKEVETISLAVQENYQGYSEAIVNMSKKLPDSAVGLTNAYYQVVSAGYDGAQGLKVLEEASKGAVAGVTDTLTAVDGLTTVLNAFSIGADHSSEVMDMMFKAVEKGKTTFPELASNIAQAAPIAASAGMGFDQLMAAVATLTKQGTPTAEAMTMIRASILSLNEILGDGWSKTMTYQEAVQKVYEMSNGSQSALQKMMGRVEGMNAVLGMSGKNMKMAADDLEAIKNSAGASAKAFETMAETASNQFKILHNNVVAQIKPLGEGLLEYVSYWTRAMNKMFDALNEKAKENRNLSIDKLFGIQQIQITGMAYNSSVAEGSQYLFTVNEIVEQLEKMGINIENAWTKVYDAIENKSLTAEQRANNLLKLLYELHAQEAALSGIDDEMDAHVEAYEKYKNSLKEAEELSKKQTDSVFGQIANKEFEKYATEEKRRSEEQAAQRQVQLQQMAVAEEYFNSRNKKWLEERIELLTVEMDKTEEYSYARMKYEEELTERKQQLNAILAADNRKTLETILRDISSMSNDELQTFIQNAKTKMAYIEENSELWKAWIEKIQQAEEESENRQRKHLEYLSEALNELGNFVSTFDENIGKAAYALSDLISNVNRYKIAASNGDPFALLGANIGIGSSYISIMKALFPGGVSENEKFLSQMERLNAQTQKQIDLLRRLNGEEALSGIIDLYGKLNNEIEQNSRALLNVKVASSDGTAKTLGDIFGSVENILQGGEFSSTKFGFGGSAFYAMSKQTRDIINGLIKDIEGAKDSLLDYQEEYAELVTATTAESIASSIADGFADGLDSVEVFANTFEDLMRNALIESFKRETITRYLNDFYSEFAAAASSDGELTAEEIAGLAADLKQDIELAGLSWDKIKDVMEKAGLELVDSMIESKSGLSGSIQGITEETAGLLEGQMTAIRIDMLKSLEVNKASFERLKNIDDSCYWLDDIYRAIPKIDLTGVLDRMDDLLHQSTRIANNTELLKSIDRRLMNLERRGSASFSETDTLRAMGA